MSDQPHRNMDRRTWRTRRQLKNALLSLILEKNFDEITIEDITSRAALGRTTFYLHYHDKDELMVEAINSITQEITERLPEQNWVIANMDGRTHSHEDREKLLADITRNFAAIAFRFAYEYHSFYRIVLCGDDSVNRYGRYQNLLQQSVVTLMTDRIFLGGYSLKMPIEIFTNYLSGAVLSLVTWWLKNDCTPYSPEEMAEMFMRLYTQGAASFMGVES